MYLCIVDSLCELEIGYMEYAFVYSCFCFWARTWIHGVCVYVWLFNNNAQTHTPCIRVLTHTKKQQCTNTYTMYSSSNSHKETTMHKHVLHVVVFVCELKFEYMEYPFVHSCFFVWAITRIHRICFYILLFLLLNQYQNTWSMYLCIVDSLCELEIEYMEYAKKQQCTNTYSVYSSSNSHKETTMYKHILHVFEF
jgi:hypothetical protein